MKSRCKFAVVLSALLLMQLICGCSGTSASGMTSADTQQSSQTAASGEKTVILVDNKMFTHDNVITQFAADRLEDLNLEFSVLSDNAQERETQVSALRVEIMSGAGPDGYLLSAQKPNAADRLTALFPNVERSMRAGVFLPLDDYIEKSEYMTPSDHLAAIFDAGKTDEGQTILPLTYYSTVLLLDKAQLADPDFAPKTWNELTNANDPSLLKAVRGSVMDWFGAQFPHLADYDDEKAVISSEDLANSFEDVLSMPSTESFDEETALIQTAGSTWSDDDLAYYTQNKDTINALAIPNTEGGVTAFITAYAAISRNSKNADEAFRFLELLFSDEAQRDSAESVNDVRLALASLSGQTCLLTHKNAYAQAELINETVSRINAVRFYSIMDYTIYDTGTSLLWTDEPNSTETARRVSDTLSDMLAE